MRLVLANEDGLNAVVCDRLLARLMEPRSGQATELTIDLSKATFIDPYGAACLSLIARHISGRGQRLICVLPSSSRTQQTASDLGLIRQLQSLAEVRNRPIKAARSRENVLPLSLIRSRNDVNEVLNYLVSLSRSRLGFDTGDVLDAGKVVSELCYNVVDHSGAEGLAAARIGSDRKGRRFVALAVVDAGIGIRASLARRYPSGGWRHGDAIERALGGRDQPAQRRRSRPAQRPCCGPALQRPAGDPLRQRSALCIGPTGQPRTLSGALFPARRLEVSFSQRP